MNDQEEKPARGGNESAKDLMSALLGTFRDSKSMSKNRRAYLAWVEANGERETEHTTGVFVREVAGREYPVLTVYVDNRMCMIDFLAQREIYRARLSEQGLEFSDLEFKLDKYNRHTGKDAHLSTKQAQNKKVVKKELPELTAEEKSQISELVSDLSEPLKSTAYKAIEASFRQKKSL